MDSATLIAIAVTIVFLIIIVPLAKRAAAKRNDFWENFARTSGLTFDSLNHRVHGTIEGRSFSMESVASGSRSNTILKIGIKASLPAGFAVKPDNFLFPFVRSAFAPNRIKTGDAGFDKKALVSGQDPAAVMAFLTEKRKAALLKLVEMDGQIQNGRCAVSSHNELTKAVNTALSVAKDIEAEA